LILQNNFFRINARILSLLLLLALFYNGCTSITIKGQESKNEIADFPIYVVNHGWHTGVVIDRKAAKQYLPSLNNEFVNSKYIEIGWGDKEYYQAEEVTTMLTIQTILYPTDSVLHIVEVPIEPKKYFPDSKVIKLLVTDTGFKNMLGYIDKTFKRDSSGKPIKIGKALYGYGFFYSANGKFYVCNTCNTWIANVLDEAGLPVSSFFTFTATDVMDQLSVKPIQ